MKTRNTLRRKRQKTKEPEERQKLCDEILEIYNKDYQNPLNTFASCWPEVYYKINEMTKQSN